MKSSNRQWWLGEKPYEYSAEYQAVIDYADANGITKPPARILQEDDARVRAAVADGSWANEDLVYYFRNRADYRAYARINWKNPGTYNITEVGTLTFDEQGFWGDGSTGYLRTNYVPSTHAVNFTLNNGSVRGFTASNIASSTYLFGCETTGSTRRLLYIPRNVSDVAAYVINGTSSDTTPSVTNHYGFFHIKRTSSTAFAIFRDGVSVDSSTNASTSLPEFELYILAANTSGTANGFSARNIGCFLVGASQNGLESANNEIWNDHYFNNSLGFTPTNTYFLMMDGQSNSEGIDPITSLSLDAKDKFRNTYIWFNAFETPSGGRWEKLRVVLNNQRSSRTSLNTFGAEIRIAERFEAEHPNDVLYISKYAVGSTPIISTAGNDWNASSVGELLDIAIDNFHIPARAAIPSSPIIDLGMIWAQGEQDCAALSTAANFFTATVNMFSEFRTRLSNSTLKIFVARLHQDIDRDATLLGQYRVVQGPTSTNLTDTATYPYNVHVDVDSYGLIDTVHFEQYQYGSDLYDALGL